MAPKGCLANPIFPAPTIARFCPGNQLADTVMKALALVVPKQVSAGIGNLKVIAFSGLQGETHWVHMEIFEGSYGGRLGKDGMDAVDTLYANTRNNPIEDIEIASAAARRPLRDPRRHGRGRQMARRRGLGAQLHDAGRRRRLGRGRRPSLPAVGLRRRRRRHDGGADVRAERRGAARAPSKLPHMHAKAGDRFVALGPGGGGYGDPFAREAAQVRADVLDGYITADQARREYGVALGADLSLDISATAALRATRPGV